MTYFITYYEYTVIRLNHKKYEKIPKALLFIDFITYFQRIERIAPVPAETATDMKEPSRTDKSEDLEKCDKVNGSLYMAQYADYTGYRTYFRHDE